MNHPVVIPAKAGIQFSTFLLSRFKAWIPAFAGMTLVLPVYAVAPEVKIEPLAFSPAQAERVQLKNGAVVYILEDHELPLFNMNIRIKTSPADETVPETMNFLDSVWRTGGTKNRAPDQLNDELEQMAASVETSADKEAAVVGLSCLSKDIPKGLSIFADVLLNPAFNADQLALDKAKTLEGLRRKNETPTQIARRAFRDCVYGPSHVYAGEPTEKTVARVTRVDLAALHKKIVAPDRAVISVAGDFVTADLISQLEVLFSSWPATGRLVPSYDYSVKNPNPGRIFFVQKDANQSRVTIGRVGPARHNPDHFSLQLADHILGGGGPSRLFGQIRSRLGLAYVVGSFVQEPAGPGLLGVACQTKAPSTVTAIKAIEKELDAFVAGPIRDDEIKLAKDSIVNAYIFGFDSPWDVVNARAANEFFGYATDYIDTAADRVRNVSREDVARVAKRYYGRGAMKIMVVGDERQFTEPLDSLGSVTRIPLHEIP